MINKKLINKYYSHIRSDRQLFDEAVLRRVDKNMTILDAGAGSGEKHNAKIVRDKCLKIIGVDLDQSVITNKNLDVAINASLDNIPLPDDSIDLIYSRYVFEHLSEPDLVVNEFARLLRKDGYLIVLTPNKYHYVSIISRLTPHEFHEWVNKKRGRKEEDTFPTVYRCNTAKSMVKIMEKFNFKAEELIMHEGVPNYLLWNRLTFLLGLAYERLVNCSNVFENGRISILGVFKKL